MPKGKHNSPKPKRIIPKAAQKIHDDLFKIEQSNKELLNELLQAYDCKETNLDNFIEISDVEYSIDFIKLSEKIAYILDTKDILLCVDVLVNQLAFILATSKFSQKELDQLFEVIYENINARIEIYNGNI